MHTLGAVLLQEKEEEQWQPAVYASRGMTGAERRYGQREEALAATWACENFNFYLVGRSIQIESDHKPLIPFLGSKYLSALPLHVQQFKMGLMRYCFSIFHTPGTRMYLADLLSRPSGRRDVDKARRVEEHALRLLRAREDKLLHLIRESGDKDVEYAEIRRAIEGPSKVEGD